MQVRYGVYRVLEFSWSFVESSCPSILWCHYLLLPWYYRHENWHVTPSPTDNVIVSSSMTSLFRKFGRWFSSLDPKSSSRSLFLFLSWAFSSLRWSILLLILVVISFNMLESWFSELSNLLGKSCRPPNYLNIQSSFHLAEIMLVQKTLLFK